MGRTTELASIMGAGAAGAVMAVLAVGGSLLLVLPAALIVGLVTLVVGDHGRRHRAPRS